MLRDHHKITNTAWDGHQGCKQVSLYYLAIQFNLILPASVQARKHFLRHRGMAMPDRFWVKLKNQTNFELLSTVEILLPKIFQIFDLKGNFLVKNVDCTYFLMSQPSNFQSI